MPKKIRDRAILPSVADTVEHRGHAPRDWFKNWTLQNEIFNNANFSIIATDEKGVIQIFNEARSGC